MVLSPVFLTGLKLYSQNIVSDPQKLIADIIEDLSANSESDLDLTSIAEDLNQLLTNPLNINSCNLDDLSKLCFLSDFQVQSLWDYIQVNKPILNVFELQLVVGFEKEDVIKLMPFIRFETEPEMESLKAMLTQGKHELTAKTGAIVETAQGYQKTSSTPGYLGSKLSLYTRYNYTFSNKLQWGLTAEKDAGEQFFKGYNSQGFDYLAGYVLASNIGIIKKAVIGDFDVEFGQGLSFWSTLSTGKSTNPLGVRKRARGIRQHSSSNENRFLRGAGATISFKKIDFTVFGSAKMVDANAGDSTINGDDYYTSLPETGLHRTLTEIKDKHTLGEKIAGANLQYNLKRAKVGITFSHLQMDGKFTTRTSPVYTFQQMESQRTTTSLYTDYNLKNHFVFSEFSVQPDKGEYAAIAGGVFKLSPTVDYSIVARSYSRGYNSIYTAGFAEGSTASNENGIFNGVAISLIKGLKISAFYDLYRFPWLRYRAYAPSTGHDYFLQADINLHRNFILSGKYRNKMSQENFTSLFDQTISLINKKSQNIRLQLNYEAVNRISLQSRFDFVIVSTDSTKSEKGFLLAQDLGYEFQKTPLSLSLRYSIFDTDSWNSRIYAYESDLLYSFSVPANYSQGSRVYLMVRYKIFKNFDLWLRWSQTYYHSLNVIGSGLDAVNGDKKNDVRMMLRVRF